MIPKLNAFLTSHELELVSSGNVTGQWLDEPSITFFDNAGRSSLASMPKLMSTALATEYMSGITKKTLVPPNLWNIFSPFSADLCLAIAICFVVGSTVMVVLKSVWTAKPLKVRTVIATFYHTLAAFLGSDEYEHLTSSGKLYRLGSLFFVHICTATYTANLAALLVSDAVGFPLEFSKAVWAQALCQS